jgi:hypothetical protein
MPKLILTDETTDWSEETLITHAVEIMFWVTMRGQLLVVGVRSIYGRELISGHLTLTTITRP